MAETAERVNMYMVLDEQPEIAEARDEVRRAAWALMTERQNLVRDGRSDEVPLTVDALSTADFVLETEVAYGKESPEYQEHFEGLLLDCRRLVAEWYRKNKPEYFAETKHTFDHASEAFYSHGVSTRQMTENALVPVPSDLEETTRRINEKVEDETPLIIRKLGSSALSGAKVRTISECSDSAISAYQAGINSGYMGYVAEIEKLMVRDIRLDDETGDRYEEQVALPGIYINHYVIQEALRRRGVEAGSMDKTALHGMQLLAEDDLISFVQLLDTVASEEWCVPVFMGEAVEVSHPRNYESIKAEAYERQNGLLNESRAVALFVLSLAENATDRHEAPELVEAFVKKLLFNKAQDSYELAAQIFDKKTAEGLKQVAQLYDIGRPEEAIILLEEVQINAPGGGYCGAGSCGLEAVTAGSKEEKRLQEELGFGKAKDLIKDTERKCKCGAKTVFYDLKQGKKGCSTCHKTMKY